MKPKTLLKRGVLWCLLCAACSAHGCGGDGSGGVPLTPENYSVSSLWRDLYDSGDGNALGYEYPGFLVVADGVVVVSGSSGTESGHPDGILRAYDAKSGSVLWTKTLHDPECLAGFGQMVVLGSRLIVGGGLCTKETVRGFELRSGGELWSTEEDDGPSQAFAPLIVSDGTHAASVSFEESDATIQMHDTVDGSVVWEADTDISVFPFAAASEKAVVVAGSPDYGDGPRIHAYDSATGAVLWTVDVGRASRFQSLDAIAMGSGVLVTATWPGFFGSRLQARDELTGDDLWSFSTPTWARSIVVDSERVYVAGVFKARVRDKFSVSAYSKSTGDLLWEDQRNRKGIDERAEWAVLDDGRLIVGGPQMQIRVYNAATGEVLEEVSGDFGVGIGRGLVADAGRIFSLAGAFEPDAGDRTTHDILLRAFREELP